MRGQFLYCRITVNKVRCNSDFSIAEKVDPTLWDAKKQKIRGGSPEAELQNTRLGNIRAQIKKLEIDLSNKKKPISADLLKQLYLGKKRLSYTLLEVSEKRMLYVRSLPPGDIAQSTIKTYSAKHSNLAAFLKARRSAHILPEEFTPSMADDFIAWMRTEKKPRPSKQVHANTTLAFVRVVIRYAINQQWCTFNPLQAYTIRAGRYQMATYLLDSEIEAIHKKEFDIDRLKIVKDAFLFLCHTGLSFRDMARFRFSEHCVKEDSMYWIDMSRIKTGVDFFVPVSREAYRILKSHGGETVPVRTNQKFNAYLKEIQDLCGIQKNLSAKVGRTTFGFVMLNKMGVPLDTVSKMLGHTSVKTTEKYYAKVLKQKIIRDVIGKNRGYYDIDP